MRTAGAAVRDRTRQQACVNMCRLDVNVIRPRSAGEATGRPRSELLPSSQASASERNGALSLRSDSITASPPDRGLGR